ncbi:MAG TPA: hypothetical protein DIW43_11975 [Spongiibacteraceae bacterium]|nr:hypothetical protein [Spongiibacteraceae bacterium]HCS28165.1 hypothetical protein [Spongiibacteraceae bacterium]|tara:strand:- start:504 stop:947 length:444 start_codon:yes stop_codon:yes gene_type:complete
MFESPTNNKPFLVLMTADCVSDIVALNGVINSIVPGFREYWVPDGRELLKYLMRSGQYADRSLYPEPDLVLFSDESSAVCSFRVLRIARRHKLSKRIPFVLLSGSARESEKRLADKLGARLFVQQPVDKLRFSEQLSSLKEVCERAA